MKIANSSSLQNMGNNSSSNSYDPNKDPCDAAMQAYLKCVEGHKDGLTEGDDCTPEASAYKECRKQQQQSTQKKESITQTDKGK